MTPIDRARRRRDWSNSRRRSSSSSATTAICPRTPCARTTPISANCSQHLAARQTRKQSELTVAHFDTDGVRGYLEDRTSAGSPRSSAARHLATLRTFARYLVTEGRLDVDPTALVGSPRRDQTLPAHLGTADMDKLLQGPDAVTPAGRRDRAIIELFYASGLRLSELCDIDLEDVNLSRRSVRVRGKGGKERMVPFNGATEKAIREMLADHGKVRSQKSEVKSRAQSEHDNATRCFSIYAAAG